MRKFLISQGAQVIGAEELDREEWYHNPAFIKSLESDWNNFANFFEELEKLGKQPYVVVWY